MDKKELKEEIKRIKAEKEKLKLEMAKELGLFEKVKKYGWKSLTSKESGRIGGKISAKIRAENKK